MFNFFNNPKKYNTPRFIATGQRARPMSHPLSHNVDTNKGLDFQTTMAGTAFLLLRLLPLCIFS
jgi:hypothetical protein|tara:strand:- start:2720 stop:2911 length:192 start_codon:yes stop_codon:yes gene_type:complete